MLNNLVRVHEEVPVVKITKTKATYDKLLEMKGPEVDYSSESSEEEELTQKNKSLSGKKETVQPDMIDEFSN